MTALSSRMCWPSLVVSTLQSVTPASLQVESCTRHLLAKTLDIRRIDNPESCLNMSVAQINCQPADRRVGTLKGGRRAGRRRLRSLTDKVG